MSRRRFVLGRARALALFLLLADAGRAIAADEPAVELDELVIPLPRPETAAGPTAASTVIPAGNCAGEAKSTAEVIATSPGVAVQQYGGLGKVATVSIRGSSADQVAVMLDGMPLGTAAGGGVDLSNIPAGWISRIEVVRGAEGAHYGAGALGGAVNVVTRPARSGSWSAEATGGSFTTGSAGFDIATGGERWALMGAVSAEGSGGRFPYRFDPTPLTAGGLELRFRDHNNSRLAAALVKAWALAGPGRADALLQLSAGRRDLPGWPYYLTPDDEQIDARALGRVRYALPLADRIVLTGEGFGRLDRLDLSLKLLGSDWVRQRGQESGGGLTLSWLHGAGTLTAALSASREAISGDSTGGHARGHFWASLSEELTIAGGSLRVSPALRAEQVGSHAGFSGKLGARLELVGPLALRASAGRTFRAPSFAELYLQQGVLEPNPQLASESAWTADAALVAEGPFGLASAGAFMSFYRDLVVYESAAFRRVMPVNDTRALVRGAEVEIASAPLRRLLGATLSLAYTFLATESLTGAENMVGKELPRRPRHRLHARLGFEEGPAELHVEAQVVSAQWQDRQNLQAIPAARTVGVGLGWRFWREPEVGLHLEVKNLLDDRTLQDGFANPLPGRMWLVTLRVNSSDEEPRS